LEGPSFYALLTKLWSGGFKVCVAERSANTSGRFSNKQRLLRRLYRAADRITTNSEYQADVLRRHYPQLESRLTTIRNCVGQEFFSAHSPFRPLHPWDNQNDWLAVVGQIAPWKNLHGLIDGLIEYRKRFGSTVRVRWAGRPAEAHAHYVEDQKRRIAEHRLSDQVELLGNVEDIPRFLQASKGLLHPSTVEGFPNAVCEAFAVGLPAIIGDISDARILIGNDRGMLFDPSSPSSIATALRAFVELPAAQRDAMGSAAWHYAVDEFEEAAMAENYAEFLAGAGRLAISQSTNA
jgi:glycosyltransferase involved in cell wall biosynthesis